MRAGWYSPSSTVSRAHVARLVRRHCETLIGMEKRTSGIGRDRKGAEIALGDEVVHEPGLPCPWVTYPRHYGAFHTFAPSPEGPWRFCSCARKALTNRAALNTAERDETGPVPTKNLPPTENGLIFRDDAFGDDLCHLCNDTTPSMRWAHEMYEGKFNQFYGWYTTQERLASGAGRTVLLPDAEPGLRVIWEKADASRLPRHPEFSKAFKQWSQLFENRLRARLGYVQIGDANRKETQLARFVEQAVKSLGVCAEVVRNARPKWLGGLELDIYVPELCLAIEYQGEQHSKPIEAWGGQDRFEQLLRRDQRKAELCAERGITLKCWDYSEDVTQTAVNNFVLPHFLDRSSNHYVPFCDDVHPGHAARSCGVWQPYIAHIECCPEPSPVPPTFHRLDWGRPLDPDELLAMHHQRVSDFIYDSAVEALRRLGVCIAPVRGASPPWLTGPMDVWIPELGLGVEHRDLRHFAACERWGDMPALEAFVKRDRLRLSELASQQAVVTRFGRDLPATFDQIEMSIFCRYSAATLKDQPDPLPRCSDVHPEDPDHRCGTRKSGGFQGYEARTRGEPAPDLTDHAFQPLTPGVLVSHATFGVGQIVAVEGRGDQLVVTVDFGTQEGTKRLLVRYARLQVVRRR